MRKRFTESRTYEEANEIAESRLSDARKLYDFYMEKEKSEGAGTYFVKRRCPYCGEEKYIEEEKFQERYGVARCKRCHSLYVNPCPTQDVLNDYYVNYECNKKLEDVYKERAQKSSNVILDGRLDTIIKYIKKIPRNEINVLEIGCSNGSFLSKLRVRLEQDVPEKKCKLFGVDANENAILSNEDEKINLVYSTVEEYLERVEERFDIVWHSELIEHIINPHELFNKLYEAMSEDGYMIFTTPNDFSVEMRNMPYNAPRVLACNIFPPMHLNAFSTTNITHFALRSNFCVEEISTPGNFDVEMQQEYVKSPLLWKILEMSEEEKEWLQEFIRMSGVSSHMQCVLSKI